MVLRWLMHMSVVIRPAVLMSTIGVSGVKQIMLGMSRSTSKTNGISPTFPVFPNTLTLTLFGNAGGGEWGEPPDSYIQVFTVGEDWDESTLSWNNAPLALENISGTWVQPRDYSLPDQPYHWNVSRVVAQAYANGEPLRLALYSADGERHTGKYFWSSDVGDWNALARPSLQVVLGKPCEAPEIDCNFLYIPLAKK